VNAASIAMYIAVQNAVISIIAPLR
jgi:hypothetical protein